MHIHIETHIGANSEVTGALLQYKHKDKHNFSILIHLDIPTHSRDFSAFYGTNSLWLLCTYYPVPSDSLWIITSCTASELYNFAGHLFYFAFYIDYPEYVLPFT